MNLFPQQLEMFEFFGKLLGICLRTRLLLPLSLPRLFWKLLTWQSPNLKDFSQVTL